MPQQNDLLDSVYANGPFSQQLQAPTYQASQQQGSGFQGATGNVAQLADHFLAGISQGRAQAYNKSMQQKQQTFNTLSAQAQQLQQSDLPPEIKAQQLAKVNDLRGHVFLDATGDGGSSKGKKGGGQSSGGDDPNHPGPHILNAVRGMVTGMLGPGKQPGTVDPKELQDIMAQNSQLIGNAPKLAQEHVAGLDNQVSQALGPMVKANDGKMPAFSQAMSDPNVMQAFSANMQRNGGKLTPGAQATWDAMQAQEKQKNSVDTVRARTEGQVAVENIRGANQAAVENKKLGVKKEEDSAKAKIDQQKAETAKKVADSTIALHNAQTSKNYAEAGVAKQKLADAKEEHKASSTVLGNGKSLDSNAWDFISTARIDAKGLGKDAVKDKDKIMDRMDKIMDQYNLSSGDVAVIRAGTKADNQTLAKLNTTAQQVSGFEGTLNRNLDTLLKLDKSNPRYDAQLANRVVQAFRTGKGDPEALNMAAQMHGVSREWAKIMAGNMSASGVPISEARDSDDILSRNMSSGQMKSLIENVIRPDAANRSAENKSQLDNVRKRLRTFQGYKPDTDRGSEAESGAPPTPKGTPPATPQQANGAPPQAQQGVAPPQQAQQPGPPQQRGAAPPQAQQQPGPPQVALPMPSRPGQKLTDTEVVKAYLKAAGGDVNKARELAKQHKWEF